MSLLQVLLRRLSQPAVGSTCLPSVLVRHGGKVMTEWSKNISEQKISHQWNLSPSPFPSSQGTKLSEADISVKAGQVPTCSAVAWNCLTLGISSRPQTVKITAGEGMAICSVVTLCQAHGHLPWMCQSVIHSICDFTICFCTPSPRLGCPFSTQLSE